MSYSSAVKSSPVEFIRKNIYLFSGFAVVLAIFLFRFVNITSLPVFADEAIYIRWSQIMKAEETLRFIPLSDGKQPFFMWATMVPLKFIADPLFAGRIVSVFSGLLSLVGVCVLSYSLFKSKTASLVAGILYAVSPYTFFFDRMALADSMLSMFGIWIFIFSFWSVKNQRWDLAMLAGFSLGGAWLTKSPALFFALLLPFILVFVPALGKVPKSVFLIITTFVIGFSMYNILRLGPNFHMISSRNADYVYPFSHILTEPINPFKTFIKMYFEWIWAMGSAFLIPLAVLGMVDGFRKYWKYLSVIFIWFLFPVLVQSEFARVFTARYALFSVPFLIVLASSAFLSEKKTVKKFNLLFISLGVIFGLLFNLKLINNPALANLPHGERSGYLEEWTAGQGIKEVSEFIRLEQKNNPNEKIVVGTEGYFGTLPDGLQIYLNDLRQITVVGIGLDISNVPDALVNSKKYGNRTYLVINSDRFKGDAKGLGLKLIKSYPKAVRADGSSQSLLFFEVDTLTKTNL